MKKILVYLLFILLFSCSTKKQKEELIGNWYSNSFKNYGFFEFRFYKDSLIVNDEMLGRFYQDWKIRKNNIFLSNIRGLTDKKKLTYAYELDNSKQFLNLKIIGDTITELPKLRKAKNAFDFFKKTIDLEIELPKSNDTLKIISEYNRFNFNIYAGFKKDKLVMKTDFSSDLNNLDNEIESFCENKQKWIKPLLRFNLIADKNISVGQIDLIVEKLEKTSIKQIFRSYQNKNQNYENNLIWFGQKIKN